MQLSLITSSSEQIYRGFTDGVLIALHPALMYGGYLSRAWLESVPHRRHFATIGEEVAEVWWIWQKNSCC